MASIGYVPGRPEFLQTLRRLADEYGIVLIFDEVQTFRVSPGGAQQLYDITPDMTVLGKIIGGGLPVGGLGGKSEIMALFDPTEGPAKIPHAGTFNGNPMTMTAGITTLTELTPAVYNRLAQEGTSFRKSIAELGEEHGIPLQVTGEASLLHIHFTDQEVKDFRDTQKSNKSLATKAFLNFVNHGVFPGTSLSGNLSVPMEKKDMDTFLEVFEGFLKRLHD